MGLKIIYIVLHVRDSEVFETLVQMIWHRTLGFSGIPTVFSPDLVREEKVVSVAGIKTLHRGS